MNEFTKDELQHLYECVADDCDRLIYQNFSEAVLRKLQSMIDNYCEHTNKSEHYGFEPIDICDNCGVIYEKTWDRSC